MGPRALILVTLVVAACGASAPTNSPAASDGSVLPTLHIHDGTPLGVSLVVNGQPVADASPSQPDPPISLTALPPLPWNVEARSRSGRVLISLRVRQGDFGLESTIAQFIDLSCGRIWIWAGGRVPDAPVPASPGEPGDCVP